MPTAPVLLRGLFLEMPILFAMSVRMPCTKSAPKVVLTHSPVFAYRDMPERAIQNANDHLIMDLVIPFDVPKIPFFPLKPGDFSKTHRV